MSMRKAINEKCKDCIYDPSAGGTWLKQVELCTMTDCPLYEYRPVPSSSKLRVKSPPKKGQFGYKEAS